MHSTENEKSIKDKIITIGDRFGKLVVLQKTGKKWNSYDCWECLCDCGNITTSSAYNLLKGKSLSCGKRMGHCDDLSGKKFGDLIVIRKAEKNHKGTLWLCLCNCGKECLIENRRLIGNITKTCGCNGVPNLYGKIFGKLKVKGRAPPSSSRQIRWECICSCGRIVYPTTSKLIKGLSSDCGRCSIHDITGQRFGNLIALAKTEEKKGTNSVWICKCDCGKIVRVSTKSLSNGGTKSCGCLRILFKDRSIPAKRRLYLSYKYMAFRKGKEFLLSMEDFLSITTKCCYYCGSSPSNLMEEGKVTKIRYEYNGIDRIDNTKGYVPGNVVPCCKICNMAKTGMPLEEFLCWARRFGENAGKLSSNNENR